MDQDQEQGQEQGLWELAPVSDPSSLLALPTTTSYLISGGGSDLSLSEVPVSHHPFGVWWTPEVPIPKRAQALSPGD